MNSTNDTSPTYELNQAIVGTQQWPAGAIETFLKQNIASTASIAIGNLMGKIGTEEASVQAGLQNKQSITNDIAEINDDLQEDRAIFTIQEDAVTAATQKITSLTQSSDALTERIGTLGQTITTLTEEDAIRDSRQIPAAQAEVARCQKNLATATSKRIDAEKTLAPIQKQDAVLLQSIKAYQAPNARSAKGPVNKAQLAALQKQYAVVHPKYVAMLNQVETLRKNEDVQKAALDDASKVLIKLQTEDDAKDEEILAKKKEKAQAEQDLAATIAERIAAEEILRKAQSAADALRTEILQEENYLAWEEDVLADIAADVAQHQQTLAAAKDAVRQSIQELLANPVTLEDPNVYTSSPSLAQGKREADNSWQVNLTETGGSALFSSWQGKSQLTGSVDPADATSLHRALVGAGLSAEEVAKVATLTSQFKMAEGFIYVGNPWWITRHGITFDNRPPLKIQTYTTPELGTVTVDTGTMRIASINGVLGASVAQVDENYVFQPILFGSGPLSLTLAEPKYVQWVNVEHLGGPAQGMLEVTKADGTKMMFPLGESGAIAVDAIVSSIRLIPAHFNERGAVQSAYGIRSINTAQPTGVPDIAAGTELLQMTGAGAALDLRNAGKAVTDVAGTIISDSAGEQITAHFYNGEHCVGTQVIGADGVFTASNDSEFITSVVFTKTQPDSKLYLSGLMVNGRTDTAQASASALSPETNLHVALVNELVWSKYVPTGDTVSFFGNQVIGHYRGGDPLSVGRDPLYVPIQQNMNSHDEYSTLKLISANGSAAIAGVYLVMEDGKTLAPLDQRFWRFVSGVSQDNAIIVFPGAAPSLYIKVIGQGQFSYPGVTTADTCMDALPPVGTVIRTDVLAVLEGQRGNAEGWGEINQAGYPSKQFRGGGGDTVKFIFEIANDGQTGTPVTVHIRQGTTGTSADPIIRTFTGDIGGLCQKVLTVITTLHESGETVSIEVLDAKGNVLSEYGRKVHEPPPAGLTPEQYRARLGSRSMQTLTQHIIASIGSIPGWQNSVGTVGVTEPTVESVGVMMQMTAAAQKAEYEAFLARGVTTEELIAMNKAQVAAALGAGGYDPLLVDKTGTYTFAPDGTMVEVGGAEIEVETIDTVKAMKEITDWYKQFGSSESLSVRGEYVNTTTQAGNVFAWLYKNALSVSPRDAYSMCRKAAAILGIPSELVSNVIVSHDQERFEKMMIDVFRLHGFSSIFSLTSNPPQTGDHITAITNRNFYHNGMIRLYFDQPATISGNHIHHTSFYLVRDSDKTKLSDIQFGGEVKGKLSVDIAVADIAKAMGNYHGPISLMGVSWAEDASGNPIDAGHIKGYSNPITVEWDGTVETQIGDFSTLPNTPQNFERRLAENSILSTLKEHFFLDEPNNWSWLIASTSHHDNAYNAIDLSRTGTADDKAPIKAPADGKVVYNKLDSQQNPTLILEHTIFVNGHEWFWYTKYLHMYHDTNGQSGPIQSDGTISPLALNSTVTQGTTMINVGNFGNNGKGYETHLHEETFMAPDGKQLDEYGFFNTDAIDPRILLTDPDKGLHMTTYAAALNLVTRPDGKQVFTIDGATSAVHWEDSLNAWASDATKLIYNRTQQEPSQAGNDSYWIAWHIDPMQRERVRWDEQYGGWLNMSGTKQWDPIKRNWI